MAHVVVGVKRVNADGAPCEAGDPVAEVTQQWIRVGDVTLSADDGLIDIAYGVDEPGGFGVVTIRVATSSFATVDHRAAAAPPVRGKIGEGELRQW